MYENTLYMKVIEDLFTSMSLVFSPAMGGGVDHRKSGVASLRTVWLVDTHASKMHEKLTPLCPCGSSGKRPSDF